MSWYSLEQACWTLDINPRTLHKWMDEQSIEWQVNPADKRVRRMSDKQVQVLSEYYGRELRPVMTPDEMWERIQFLEKRLVEVTGVRERPASKPLAVIGGNHSKGYCARLAERHGVKLHTADKWSWPVEMRVDDTRILLYARNMMGGQTRQNWRECEDLTCPCHVAEELRSFSV